MPSVSSTHVFSLRKPSAASASGIMTLVSRMDTFLMPGTPCSATCKHRAPSYNPLFKWVACRCRMTFVLQMDTLLMHGKPCSATCQSNATHFQGEQERSTV